MGIRNVMGHPVSVRLTYGTLYWYANYLHITHYNSGLQAGRSEMNIMSRKKRRRICLARLSYTKDTCNVMAIMVIILSQYTQ